MTLMPPTGHNHALREVARVVPRAPVETGARGAIRPVLPGCTELSVVDGMRSSVHEDVRAALDARVSHRAEFRRERASLRTFSWPGQQRELLPAKADRLCRVRGVARGRLRLIRAREWPESGVQGVRRVRPEHSQR